MEEAKSISIISIPGFGHISQQSKSTSVLIQFFSMPSLNQQSALEHFILFPRMLISIEFSEKYFLLSLLSSLEKLCSKIGWGIKEMFTILL